MTTLRMLLLYLDLLISNSCKSQQTWAHHHHYLNLRPPSTRVLNLPIICSTHFQQENIVKLAEFQCWYICLDACVDKSLLQNDAKVNYSIEIYDKLAQMWSNTFYVHQSNSWFALKDTVQIIMLIMLRISYLHTEHCGSHSYVLATRKEGDGVPPGMPRFHTGRFHARLSHTLQKVNLRHTLTNIQPTIYYSCLTTTEMKQLQRPFQPDWQNMFWDAFPRWPTMPTPHHHNECHSYIAILVHY